MALHCSKSTHFNKYKRHSRPHPRTEKHPPFHTDTICRTDLIKAIAFDRINLNREHTQYYYALSSRGVTENRAIQLVNFDCWSLILLCKYNIFIVRLLRLFQYLLGILVFYYYRAYVVFGDKGKILWLWILKIIPYQMVQGQHVCIVST